MRACVGICVAAVDVTRHDRRKGSMMTENVVFRNCQFEIKHVQELALNTTDVALAKHTGAECPVDIFESGIVEVLVRHERVS